MNLNIQFQIFLSEEIKYESGKEIPIKERKADEITCGMGRRTAPLGVKTFNPAFDVTPNELITAIITEKGVIKQPYCENLKKLFR